MITKGGKAILSVISLVSSIAVIVVLAQSTIQINNHAQQQLSSASEDVRQACINLRDAVIHDTANGAWYKTPQEFRVNASDSLDDCVKRGYVPNNPITPEQLLVSPESTTNARTTATSTTSMTATLKEYFFNGTNANVEHSGNTSWMICMSGCSDDGVKHFTISTTSFVVAWNITEPTKSNNSYWRWVISMCDYGLGCTDGDSGEYNGSVSDQTSNGSMTVDLTKMLRCTYSPSFPRCSPVGTHPITLTLWVAAYGVGQWTFTIEEAVSP